MTHMPGGASSSTRLGGLALILLMLLRQHSSAHASVEPHRSCKIVGEPFTSAEDGSLWRHGIAIFGQGFRGRCGLRVVDVRSLTTQTFYPELPPHLSTNRFTVGGLSIENVTDRVYLLVHDDTDKYERIFAFGIVGDDDGITDVKFRFELSSKRFQYQGGNHFLNDIAVSQGKQIVYATRLQANEDKDRRLWQCTWKEPLIHSHTIQADCVDASDVPMPACNGIAIRPDGERVFVNVMGFSGVLIMEPNQANGGRNLTVHSFLPLPSISEPPGIDNLEYDFASGDLHMGYIGNFEEPDRKGGLMIARRKTTTAADGSVEDSYEEPRVVFRNDVDYDQWHWVSSAFQTGDYVLMGCPWNQVVACDMRKI